MTHRSPFHPLPFCDSVKGQKGPKTAFIDNDSIPAVSLLAACCKDRNAQSGWIHLSWLDEDQRCCMLDFWIEWDLPTFFWKQFKIPFSATEISSCRASARFGLLAGLSVLQLYQMQWRFPSPTPASALYGTLGNRMWLLASDCKAASYTCTWEWLMQKN